APAGRRRGRSGVHDRAVPRVSAPDRDGVRPAVRVRADRTPDRRGRARRQRRALPTIRIPHSYEKADLGVGIGMVIVGAMALMGATAAAFAHSKELGNFTDHDRITCVGGDFFADERLPEGHDAALLSSVLHDWSKEENLIILDKVAVALPTGGTIMISELLMDDDRAGPAP